MTDPVLRPLAAADAASLHAVFTEPGVRRFLFDDVELAPADTRIHLEAAVAAGGWAIEADGRLAGFVCLRPMAGTCELIVAVSERCWGRGIAFAAARALLDDGFARRGLERILARVDTPNRRSHRLMRRLGFVACGEEAGVAGPLIVYEALRRSGT